MNHQHNPNSMLMILCNLSLHYPQAGRTAEELHILTPDWCEDLDAFPFAVVERAVKTHRRQSPFFPTVAEIYALCEKQAEEASRRTALPEHTRTAEEQIAMNREWCAKIAQLRHKWDASTSRGSDESLDAQLTRLASMEAMQ